jgi:hypothetical protein
METIVEAIMESIVESVVRTRHGHVAEAVPMERAGVRCAAETVRRAVKTAARRAAAGSVARA